MLKKIFNILMIGIILIVLCGCESVDIKENVASNENNIDQNYVAQNENNMEQEKNYDEDSEIQLAYSQYTEEESESVIENEEKIELKDLDENGKNFSFEYNGEVFKASFSYGSWRIFDSYKIKNEKDIIKICEALIDIHPVYGSDGVSYRTAEDMAYEWVQHNIAYEILPEGNSWKENAKNVDLDPADQGKNLKEMFESRIGEKLDLKAFLK